MVGHLRCEGRAVRVVGLEPGVVGLCVFFEGVNLVLVRLWALRSAVGAHNPHGLVASLTDNRFVVEAMDTGQRPNGRCSEACDGRHVGCV
jgi:hypothetical protein